MFLKTKTFFKSHPVLYYLLLSFVAAILINLLFSLSISPLYPHYSYDAVDIDSAFFQYTGKLILEGKIPYRDFFDHKGPLVFYYNALGALMGERFGIAFLTFLSHFLTCFFLLLGIAEISSSLKEVTLAASLFLLFYSISEGGNQVGEIVAPLVSLSLYFFLRYQKRNTLSAEILSAFFGGVEIGATLFTRPSDALAGGSLCVGLFILWCFHIKERMLSLLYDVLAALVGVGINLAIWLPVLHVQGTFSLFFDALYRDSKSYIENKTVTLVAIARAIVLLYFLMVLLGYLRIWKKHKEKKDIATAYLVMAALFAVPNFVYAKYPQYWIVFFPLFISEILFCFVFFPLPQKKKDPKTIASLISFFLSLMVGCGFLIDYYTSSDPDFSYRGSKEVYAEIEENVPSEIQKGTDTIFYLDCNAAVLLKEDNRSSCPYQTYQSWQASFLPSIDKEVTSYLQNKKPLYIVKGDNGHVEKKFTYDTWIEQNYEKVEPRGTDSPIIEIYRLKENA
ncbi:MAG: hypothetical protein PUA93_02150 [Eubacteriales bacterium]|nr:hypothetical protein [Eubacteriales bacterium]